MFSLGFVVIVIFNICKSFRIFIIHCLFPIWARDAYRFYNWFCTMCVL